MYSQYISQAEKLENEAKELRETAKRWKYGYDNIYLGRLIQDLETGLIMKVVNLKNGSNDFEAKSVDNPKSPGRGYHYTVNNWQVFGKTKLALKNSVDIIYRIIQTEGAGRLCPPYCICSDKGCSKESIRESLYKY